MNIMNNDPQDEHLDLDYVLKRLNGACISLNSNKLQDVIVTFHVQEPEDLNDILYTSSVLMENKIINGYSEFSSGEEDIETGFSRDHSYKEKVHLYKYKYVLIPKVLNKYMIDTSRLPKYSLEFDDVQSKVILNKKYILSKLDYDGPNYIFFSYTIKKSRKIIRKENFTKDFAGEINLKIISKRTIRSILENVLKNSELIKVFFPLISKDSAYFRNDVTTKDLVGQKTNEKKIDRFIKTLSQK